MSDSIKVAVRIRPLIPRERDIDCKVAWNNTEQTIQQKNGSGKYSSPYIFDRVFGMDQSTDDVYEEMALPIVEGAMQGFNGTVFAYGQTSSGKTYTMLGTKQKPGIIPRVVEEIFNCIENNPEREFLIRVSYLEIYNENVTDLLSGSKKPLDVREDTEGNVFVNNLKEELVNQTPQIMQLMEQGQAARHVGATNMNEYSSRSHTIFRIIIESRLRDAEGAVMVSQLNLVDLAGSEKAKATGATGQRLTEGGFINKSLFILGNVISQLSEGVSFVSYRDSRLTRILQNSLGGNSKTVVICNISPVVIEETHSSLRFATNAKRIKNKPVQNEVVSDAAMLQRYKKEISKLQAELSKTRSLQTVVVLEENEALQQQLAEKEAMRKAQEEKIDRLEQLICVSSQIKPTTPDVKTFAARKRRRETWCPGKGGLLRPPKIPEYSGGLDVSFPARKVPKSLPNLEEISGSEEDDSPPGMFRQPTFKDHLPELSMNVSSFSNEEFVLVEKECQTEKVMDTIQPMDEDLGSAMREKDELIQDLRNQLESTKDEVVTLNQLIDTNLENDCKAVAELKLEVHRLQEELSGAIGEKKILEEKLANTAAPSLTDELVAAEERSTMTSKLESLDEENRLLTEKLNAAEGEIQKLLTNTAPSTETQNLNDELSSAVEKENMSEKLAIAEQQIQDLLAKLAAAEQDNMVIMESQALALDRVNMKEDQALSELLEKLASAEAEILQLSEKLSEAEEYNKNLTQELSDVKKEVPKTAASRPSMGLGLVQSQLDTLRTQIAEKDETIRQLELEHTELKQMVEEVLDDINSVKNQKILVEEERDRLKTDLQDLQYELEKRDKESKEMEEFLTFERDMKNDSIMYHQIGEDMVEKMKEKIKSLEQSLHDTEALLMDKSKALACGQTEREDLKKSLAEANAAVEQLTNEKSDFNMYQELDKDKHKRREAELTAQLEEAYQENAELAAAVAGGNQGSGNLEASLRMAESPQVEQLQAELHELTQKLEESEKAISSLREELETLLVSKNQAEEKLVSLRGELEQEHKEQLANANLDKDELLNQLETLGTELTTLKERSEKDKSDMTEKMKEEYEALKKEHESKVETLEEELKNNERTRMDLVNDHKTQYDEERQKYEDMIANLQEEHTIALQSEKQQSQALLEEKILAIRDEAMKRLEEAKAALAETSKVDSNVTEERDAAVKECLELTQKFKEIQQQMQDSTATSERQILQLVQERDEAIGHREMLMEQVKELSSTQSASNQQTEELENLETKIKEHEERIQSLMAENAERLTINEQLNSEMELLRKEAQPRLSIAIREEEFETLTMEAMDLKELVSSLTEERDAAKQKVEDLEAKIKSLEKQIVEAKEKETNMPAVQDSEEFLEMKTQLATYEGQVEQLEECIQEQFTELNAAKEEVESLKSQQKSAEKTAEDRLETVADLQAQLVHAKQIQEELDELRSQKESAEQLADEVQKALLESQSEAQLFRENQEALIRSLEEERDAARKAAEESEKKIEKLRKQLDLNKESTQSAEASDLQVQLVIYEDQIEALNKCMAEQLEELAKEQATIKSLNQQLSETEIEKEELIQRIDTLNEDMEILKQGTEEIVENLKVQRDSAENMVHKLSEENEKFAEERDESSKEMIEKQREEIESLEAMVKQLKIERDDQQSRVSELEQDIEKLKAQMDVETETRTAEIEELMKTRTSDQMEVITLGGKVEELEAMCKTVTEDRDKLRSLCDEMNEELETKEDKWRCEKKALENRIDEIEKSPSAVQDSSSELAELRARNKELQEWYDLVLKDRDHVRDLCDELDDEVSAKEEKWDQEKKELVGEVTLLKGLLGKEKELEEKIKFLEKCHSSAMAERDEARRLCDQVDDELTEKEEKWEKEAGDYKKRISQLEAKSRKTNPADEEKMKKVEHENLFLKLRVNELENEMVRDPRGKKIKDLADDNKLLHERIASQRSEIRRYQNQLSEASFIQGSGQSGERGSRSGSSSEGIVGSVKVLTLEAEKAALERELKQSNKNLTHIQQQKKELVAKNKEQEAVIEKLRKYYKKSLKDLDANDQQVLRGIANASPAVRASQKASPWTLADIAPFEQTGKSSHTSEEPDQCTTQ